MDEHALDTQVDVFRSARPEDLVSDLDIDEMAQSGDLIFSTDAPIVPVEDYEAAQWDAGRVGPKSLEEAKAALAVRVEDPLAPDRDASVYDGLEVT